MYNKKLLFYLQYFIVLKRSLMEMIEHLELLCFCTHWNLLISEIPGHSRISIFQNQLFSSIHYLLFFVCLQIQDNILNYINNLIVFQSFCDPGIHSARCSCHLSLVWLVMILLMFLMSCNIVGICLLQSFTACLMIASKYLQAHTLIR